MKSITSSDGNGGWRGVTISFQPASQFPGFYMFGLPYMNPGYGRGVCLLLGCVPGSQDPFPSLALMVVCLSLSSGGLFSHTDPVYCVFYLV